MFAYLLNVLFQLQKGGKKKGLPFPLSPCSPLVCMAVPLCQPDELHLMTWVGGGLKSLAPLWLEGVGGEVLYGWRVAVVVRHKGESISPA